MLNAFFQPYYSLLPNYTPERRECQPDGILATNWLCDELAGYGTYTNFLTPERQRDGAKRGEKEEKEDARLEDSFIELRRGLPDRGIWFAGEHTAPFVALGTLTGAYWSGEAIGMRVLGAYGLVDNGVGV